jgi:hypothetical protein
LFSICSVRVNAMINGTMRIRDSARMSGVDIGVLLEYPSDHIGGSFPAKKPRSASAVSSGASSGR